MTTRRVYFVFFLLFLFNSSLPALTVAASPPLQAPAPSNALPSYQSESWIVEGNATGKLAPTCSDLCVTVLNDQRNFPALLQPCQGLVPTELWKYNSTSMAIMTTLSDVQLCLDAANPDQLDLTSCNGSQTQIWIWENQTMRFRSGTTDPVTGSLMYMQGEYRKPSDWGTGKNNYTLRLAAENINNDFIFTILPFYNPFFIRPNATATNSKNLVSNGGFEECGLDPGNGFITLDAATQPIPLCSWFTVSNEVEYSGPNLWQPEEGRHSLHLNSARAAQPGAVTQVLSTKVGFNYSLVFFMAGNPDQSCGTPNKTLEIRIYPSSLPPQFDWFDIGIVGAGKMGWMQVYPMGFTAFADYVNLTFTSLTPGSCGPVIDNITVSEIDGPLPPLNPSYGNLAQSSPSTPVVPIYGVVLIVLAAAGCAVAGVSFLFLQLSNKRSYMLGMSVSNRSSKDRSKFWDSLTLSRLEGENSTAKELSWREIEKATRNFTTIIGEGGFSTVYRAQFPDGTLGAVKMEKTRDRSRRAFRQELSVLLRVRHNNLVNLIGFCNEREEGILVFEYMAHGNLHYRLHPPAHQMYQPLPWKKRTAIAVEIAKALEYLHDMARPPIVHTDIKSANVLLDEDDNAKLCDFGFSSKGGADSSMFHSAAASVKGSLGYLDPQYLKSGRLSSKSDVYSFGVLVMELVTGLMAFDIHRAEALTSFTAAYVKDMEMMELIVDGRLGGEYDKEELKVMCGVAQMCVREEWGSRPTMAKVVKKLCSPWVPLEDETDDDLENLPPDSIVEEYDEADLAELITSSPAACS